MLQYGRLFDCEQIEEEEEVIYVKPSPEWANHILADDVMTEEGVLLLPKGHKLSLDDIQSILERGLDLMGIEERSNTYEFCIYINHLKKIDPEFYEFYGETLSSVERMFQLTENREAIDQEVLFETFDELVEHLMLSPQILIQLRTIKNMDQYTIQHSLNVGIMSAMLARLLELEHDEIIRIGHAGLLHDIGKAMISPEILQKPSQLDDEEYNRMKKHTKLGYDILLKNQIKDDAILAATLLHHERLNGSGYPLRKKEGQIPFAAQIVAVADVYDAISAERTYKPSMSPFHAYQELYDLAFRKELNPNIVMSFLEFVTKSMVGKKVILNDHSIATVLIAFPNEPNRPLVRIGDQYIDLRKNRNLFIQEMFIETGN
ncbi:HD-GYP domain-containing protein [Tepidibacillus marianensis]|uniref:HD-GYP domain-containing protein n=1 Tax=Tepidibacillus marianensis TaxID=3131995 RepID=UPI0030D3BB9B